MEIVLFYGLPLIELVFLILCLTQVENENSWFLITLLTVVGAIIAFVAFKTNPIEWFQENLGNIVATLIIWPFVGGLWALVKWYAYTRSEDYQKLIAFNYKTWKKHRDDGFTPHDFSIPSSLSVSNNKAKIVNWIVWWPFSLLNACTFRLVSNISSWVYNIIARVLQSFVNSSVDSVIKRIDSK